MQEIIQQEENHVRHSSRNMTEEEIREQARGSAFKKLGSTLAGIGAGALLGVLGGLAGPITAMSVALLALSTAGVYTAIEYVGTLKGKKKQL